MCYPPGPDGLTKSAATTNGNGHGPAALTNGHAKQKAASKHDAEVEDFLDMALEKYGENSLIYVGGSSARGHTTTEVD